MCAILDRRGSTGRFYRPPPLASKPVKKYDSNVNFTLKNKIKNAPPDLPVTQMRHQNICASLTVIKCLKPPNPPPPPPTPIYARYPLPDRKYFSPHFDKRSAGPVYIIYTHTTRGVRWGGGGGWGFKPPLWYLHVCKPP